MKVSRSWLWLLLVIPILVGAARLRFDAEILNLLPDHLDAVRGLKIYQENFSNARELILTLDGPDPDEVEQSARTLASLLRAETNQVEEVAWQPAWREHPDQAAELIAYLWFNQPPAVFGSLTNRLTGTRLTKTLQEAREKMATSLSPEDIGLRGYDPLDLMRLPESVVGTGPSLGTGGQLFASADGTFRILFVESRLTLVSYKDCQAWLEAIKRVVATARTSPGLPAQVKIHYTGRPAFVSEIAGGMENDMTGSAGATLATIGILFYLAHRRLLPLVWLLALLLILLGATTALGGLFFGTLNVVSLGFASILAGLSEDFGIVLYQESRSHPELSARELRREVGPGIFWSALTTAGAFLLLNLSGLPGLGELGSLVAIGILLAAVAMVYGYLPLLLRMRQPRDLEPGRESAGEKLLLFAPVKLLPRGAIWLITALLAVTALGISLRGGTSFDRSPDPLKPKRSEAYAAVEEIKQRLGRTEEPIWVIVPGQDEAEVAKRLDRTKSWLSASASNHWIAGFTLPDVLWPRAENQASNRAVLAELLQEQTRVAQATLAEGFTSNALFVTENIFHHWRAAAARPNLYWPTNPTSRSVLEKVVGHRNSELLALGLIHPTSDRALTKKFGESLPKELHREGVILSGWGFLGASVSDLVLHDFPRVMIPIVALVVVSLWLAFRSLRDVVLSLITLGFSGLCLWAAMSLLHWQWNLLNLVALPLLLGMGVDYSIHMQLALRRHEGDLLAVRRSVGRALLLAGTTTIAGFGSLAFSTNAGMASLGKICALGLTLTLLTAVYLLPVWWKK